MLWRKGYVTERVTGFCADWGGVVDSTGSPLLVPPPAVIGYYEPDQLTNVELWCRLLRADFLSSADWRLLNLGVDPRELESALAPSLASRVLSGKPENWPFKREFAWRPDLVLVGPPTEDAWEEFSAGLFALEN